MDKHLNNFIAGVPNRIKKLFKSKGVCQGKGGFNNGKKNGIEVSALRSGADASQEL